MKNIPLFLLWIVMFPFTSLSQVVDIANTVNCDVEVRYGIKISDAEYEVTDAIRIEPGGSADLNNAPLTSTIKSSVTPYSSVIILRFPSTGITYYMDCNMPMDTGISLNQSCSGGGKIIYTRAGEFAFKAE